MKQATVHPADCGINAVLVIDDHPLYCDALESALDQVFESCRIEKATSLGDGLERIDANFVPDLVVLDLRLPDVTGISGFIRLQNQLPGIPILVVSALSSQEIVDALMEAGAAGFVSKNVSVETLKKALCEVRAGNVYLPTEFRRLERTPVQTQSELHEVSARIASLTPQQARIMKLICAGKPNKQIAYELSLAEATVKAHITALLRRLGVQNRTQAAVLMENASFGARDRDRGASGAFLNGS